MFELTVCADEHIVGFLAVAVLVARRHVQRVQRVAVHALDCVRQRTLRDVLFLQPKVW